MAGECDKKEVQYSEVTVMLRESVREQKDRKEERKKRERDVFLQSIRVKRQRIQAEEEAQRRQLAEAAAAARPKRKGRAADLVRDPTTELATPLEEDQENEATNEGAGSSKRRDEARSSMAS